MENKKISLIAILIIFIIAAVFISVRVFDGEDSSKKMASENEQSSQQQIEEVVLDPIVQQALDIRETSEIISGRLHEVGDTYFVIELSVPETNQDMTKPEEMKYIQERIKVGITSATRIFDLSDIKHIVIPSNVTGVLEILDYIYNYSNDYVINIYVAIESPVVSGETKTSYVEWSSWPVNGF